MCNIATSNRLGNLQYKSVVKSLILEGVSDIKISTSTLRLALQIGLVSLFSLHLGIVYADQEELGYDAGTSSMDLTKPEWPDLDELWHDPQPIQADQLEMWRKAVLQIGDYSHIECRYKRYTAPCENCGSSYPRVYIEATENSLTAPGIRALGSWYDTPAVHDIKFWHEEQFDPSNHPPWKLLTMDTGQPTERQFKSYRDEKHATVRRLASDSIAMVGRVAEVGFHPAASRAMFEDREPTKVLSQDGQRLYLGTERNRKSRLPLYKRTQVTWSLDSENGNLLSYDIRAPRSFAPHFGVRLKEYWDRGTFKDELDLGTRVIDHREYFVRSRLTLVFSLMNHVSHWYTTFECDG